MTENKSSASVYIEPEFEKKPLKLNLDKTELSKKFSFPDHSKEFAEIHDLIENLANQVLFEWKHVPVVFPNSIIEMDNDQLKSMSENLFKMPTYDELEALSLDASGKAKKLSNDQLTQIKKTGRFNVESKNFPGKHHCWELSNFVQQGSDKSDAIMYNNLGFALELIIVYSKKCFSKVFSCFKTWKNEFMNLIDILIGLPKMSMNYNEINEKVLDELTNFLLLNLRVDKDQSELFNVTINSIASAFTLDPKVTNKIILSAPYFYRTPDNMLIDLRLFDPSIWGKVEPILAGLVENSDERYEELGKLRFSLIKKFESEQLTNSEIITKSRDALKEEWYRILFENILSNEDLEDIAPGIGKTLCDLAKALNIMKAEKERFYNDKQDHLNAYREELKKNYRIRSSVNEWVANCLQDEGDKYVEKNNYAMHQRAIEKCQSEGLHQAAYFIEREMMFLKEKKELIIKEQLEKPNTDKPLKTFNHEMLIWNPNNCIITKEGSKYTCQKTVSYTSTTRYPFWRLTNFFIRSYCHTWNSFFFLSFIVPFVSSVSFRSLISLSPYHPYKRFNREVGRMEVDKSQTVRTLYSRISAIITYIKQARVKFEALPDRGLLGKSAERTLHKIWNYIFVGGVGIVGLTVIYPPLCLGLSTLSFGLGLLSPVIIPVASLLYNLFNMFIFDFEIASNYNSGYGPNNRLFFRAFRIILNTIFCGTILPILSLLSGLVILPCCSLAIVLLTLLRKSVRVLQDNYFYYFLLKRSARVPSYDTFIARRISGPGLASNHFFQIKPEQALAAVEIYIEKKILSSYASFISDKLDEPVDTYHKVFEPLMAPYGYRFGSCEEVNKLRSDISLHYQKYQKINSEKLQALNLNLFNKGLGKIRLSENDLRVVQHEATRLVKFNYENVILKYNGQTSKEMLEKISLRKNDWSGFTGRILEEIFGVGIMKPLEEMHEVFELKVDHLNLVKYTNMIAKSQIRDDLDVVMTKYNPEVDKVRVEIHEQSVMETFRIKKEARDFIGSRKNLRNNSRMGMVKVQDLFIPSYLPSTSVSVAALTYNQTAGNETRIEYKSVEDLEGKLQKYFRFQ